MQQTMLLKENREQKKRPIAQRLAAGAMALLLTLGATVNLTPRIFAQELDEQTDSGNDTLICQDTSAEHTHTELCYSTQEQAPEAEEDTQDENQEEQSVVEEAPEEIPELGEQPKGTAWLSAAGGYSASYPMNKKAPGKEQQGQTTLTPGMIVGKAVNVLAANDGQIVSSGGHNSAEEGMVNISKQISGTDIENVFDITLTVSTLADIEEIMADPDMAVVLVMDMSATMMDDFNGKNGETTKYGVAASAAKQFVTTFAENTNGTSKIGFVTFNTYAYEACAMQPVASQSQVDAFNASMSSNINGIVQTYKDSRNSNGSITSNSRYTNPQAGLLKAKAMLDSVSNKNKFVVFLSDGLPTTYGSYVPMSSSGTIGADGVFHDGITNLYCAYGTNYSDKGATYAAGVAATMKSNGVKIYSVGVGLNTFGSNSQKNGVQFIDEQLDRAKNKGVATIDTAGKTSRAQLAVIQSGSFESWLRNSIGSNYFIEGSAADLSQKYQEIFEDLKYISITNSADLWTVTDPVTDSLEFIAFKDQNGNLQSSLTGALTSGGEDTAAISAGTIIWDLKKSGYTRNGEEFIYSVTYRVRLKNEAPGFVEGSVYETNGHTYLTYNLITTGSDGSQSVTEKRNLPVDVPSVKGYLAELRFVKMGREGAVETPLAGAAFTLSHAESCNVCRGDNVSAVSLEAMTATSAADGTVTFTNIPSGHTYILVETGVPHGYLGDSTEYTVTVAYDQVTVKANDKVVALDKVTNNVLTAETQITGTKQLTNPNGKAHAYTFNLVQVDKDGNVVPGGVTETQSVVFAEGETATDKTFAFGKLTYKANDLKDEQGNPVDSMTYYYKVTEAHSDSAGLDADESYYIVEVVVALNADRTALTATQTIHKYVYSAGQGSYIEQAAQAICFTNTLLGELTITKLVELAEGIPATEQSFKIAVKKNGSPVAAGTAYTVGGEVRYVEEGGIITLKAGETALFEKLTVGDTYTVEELESSTYGYTVSYSPAEAAAVITEKAEGTPSAAITVTNTAQTAALVVGGTKTIANPDGEKHEFTFQLQEVDGNGNAIGSPVTQTVEVEETADFLFPELSYDGTMLQGQQSRYFYYEITELASADMTFAADPTVYRVTVELKSENGSLTAQIVSIEKSVDGTTEAVESVSFTNTLLGTLKLVKKIIGEYPEGELFTFTITGLADGTYNAKFNGAEHSVTVVNGVYTVQMTHLDALEIFGIPHGTEVTITEAESEYTVRYVVNNGWQHYGRTVTVEITTTGTVVLFKNYSPNGLPQTGLLNWPVLVLAVLGLSFMGAGAVLMVRKKNKYEA